MDMLVRATGRKGASAMAILEVLGMVSCSFVCSSVNSLLGEMCINLGA